MLPPLSSIGSLPSVDQLTLNPSAKKPDNGEFAKLFQSTVSEVDNTQHSADAAVKNFLNGGQGELHTTILATQKADLQFDMFMQVRNKVVSAYQEVMKIQL